MELRHLRYVLTAAEAGSFRAAARALDVRESAISRRIRDLEDEIGAALFIRSHDGVKLTYARQQFVRRAIKARDQTRRQLDRLLNPSVRTITLYALVLAASALGRRLSIRME